MKITVLGAGAMGSIVGAFLKRGGAEVNFADPFKAHMDKIASDGLNLYDYDGNFKGNLSIETSYSMEGMEAPDVILFLVKASFSRDALSQAVIGPNTYVFTCQNGIGNIEVIEEFVPRERILGGSLNITGMLVEPGTVKYRPMGDYNIGMGCCTQGEKEIAVAKELQQYFEKGGFTTRFYPNVLDSIWAKALFNITNNPIAALERLTRVECREIPETVDLVWNVAREVEAVAHAKGVTSVSAEKFMKDVYLNHDEKMNTVGHYPSMAQDVFIYKRKTEIDVLNGAIVQFG